MENELYDRVIDSRVRDLTWDTGERISGKRAWVTLGPFPIPDDISCRSTLGNHIYDHVYSRVRKLAEFKNSIRRHICDKSQVFS